MKTKYYTLVRYSSLLSLFKKQKTYLPPNWDFLLIMVKMTERELKGNTFSLCDWWCIHVPPQIILGTTSRRWYWQSWSVSLLSAKTRVWLWLFTDEESRRDKSNEKPELFALRISWEAGHGKMEMLGLETGKHHSEIYSGGRSLPTSEVRLSDESLSRWLCVCKSKKIQLIP